MDKFQGTPGPWRFYFDPMPHPFENGQWRIKAAHGVEFPIATMAESIGGNKDANGNNPTIKANIVLATAAPDLLSALEDLLAGIEKWQPDLIKPEQAKARIAIAKALGKEI
ncbi:MAG: hypothetical protein Q8R83_05945 [Legionellaceae bacterium]|nr:hypothetical protein [Legionellaceae bacterium]